ncbi:MAG: hypothetical protein ACI9W2_005252 [Gammaproteobacteria bacterium]|jgi:hypothetical protein
MVPDTFSGIPALIRASSGATQARVLSSLFAAPGMPAETPRCFIAPVHVCEAREALARRTPGLERVAVLSEN